MPAASDLFGWLTAAGPWAVALILAVWCRLEREERIAAQTDARALRDRIMEDRAEQAEAIAALGEVTRTRIREHDQMITAVLDSRHPRALPGRDGR